MNNTKTGTWAGDLAWQHMQQYGLRLVERNFFCKGGEFNIIAYKDAMLAFVEIKYRRSQSMVAAVASLNTRKQCHLIHSAKVFLRYQRLNRLDCRFYLIAITGPNRSRHGSPN